MGSGLFTLTHTQVWHLECVSPPVCSTGQTAACPLGVPGEATEHRLQLPLVGRGVRESVGCLGQARALSFPFYSLLQGASQHPCPCGPKLTLSPFFFWNLTPMGWGRYQEPASPALHPPLPLYTNTRAGVAAGRAVLLPTHRSGCSGLLGAWCRLLRVSRNSLILLGSW